MTQRLRKSQTPHQVRGDELKLSHRPASFAWAKIETGGYLTCSNYFHSLLHLFFFCSILSILAGRKFRMASGYNLGDLRAAIEDINREVLSERGTGEVFNSDVLERLKKTRTHLIEAFTPQLVDIALIKLLNEVSRRKVAKNVNGAQSAFFANYPSLQKTFTVAKGIKKPIEKLTLFELRECHRNRLNRTIVLDNDDVQKLIHDLEKAANSEDETVEAILSRKPQ